MGTFNPFSLPNPTKYMNQQKPLLNSTPPSDEELIRSAQKGAEDAFVLLYERYFPNVIARVRFKIPESDVEDVTQEIFIAMLKSLGSFKGQSRFSTWIWTITNRKIVDYYRSRKVGSSERDEFEKLVTRSSSNHAENTDHQRDDLVSIQSALSKLPQNYQDILLMRFVDDMPFNEIALQNGQSLEATKSLFRRSMAALTKILEGDNGQ
jgi:RNA polymerase sigma factor (sigma-70 family)